MENCWWCWRSPTEDRLVGLVVKASTSSAEDPGFESRLHQEFSGVESYQWLKSCTQVATLPGAGTGWPGVSVLWLGEIVGSATSISVWQHVKLSEQICPWDTLACCWDVKQPTNNNSLQRRKRHSTNLTTDTVNKGFFPLVVYHETPYCLYCSLDRWFLNLAGEWKLGETPRCVEFQKEFPPVAPRCVEFLWQPGVLNFRRSYHPVAPWEWRTWVCSIPAFTGELSPGPVIPVTFTIMYSR